MDINDEVAVIRQHVEALQDQMRIVLMMLSQPAPKPAPQPEPAQPVEPRVITDLTQIDFPI
jgi:hypothetical protein